MPEQKLSMQKQYFVSKLLQNKTVHTDSVLKHQGIIKIL